jgi:hypothetical protein
VAEKIGGAYRRGDMREKRRWMMAEWAGYCASKPVEKTHEVVPMSAG